MAFEFGIKNTSVATKNQSQIIKNPCLLSKHSVPLKKKHVLFLVGAPLVPAQTKCLGIWADQNLPGFDYDILNSSALDVDEDTIKKQGIFRFYKKNRTNFQDYICEDQTIIVTLGFALSAITLSSDLNVECFYDYVFNKTYFYAPQTGTHVVPVDNFETLFKNNGTSWVPQDSSRHMFALRQLKIIREQYATLAVPPDYNRPRIVRIGSKQEFRDMLRRHWDDMEISWDIETSGLDFIQDKIGCITISFDGITGYFVPWEFVDVELFDEFLGVPSRFQIGQNMKFDVKFLRHNGVKNARIDYDTLQAGNLLNEMRTNGLKSLAYYYTPHGGYDNELDEFIDMYHPVTYLDIPTPILSKYATMDAIVTFLCYIFMKLQMQWVDETFPAKGSQKTMQSLFFDIKMPATNNFIEIERGGVYIDQKKWDLHATAVEKEILEIKAQLRKVLGVIGKSSYSLAGYMDDWGDLDEGVLAYGDEKDELQSTMWLGKLLEEKGWECLGRAKRGWYLTGDAQLERWAKQGHTEAELLQNLRSWLTLQKTFMGRTADSTMGWRRYVRAHKDGTFRIHPTYKSMMMDTLRNGCGDPNYQQIPSHSLGAEHFKRVFSTPDPEKYYLVTMDYASFQMRLAAIDSEDPVLFGEYKKNPNVDMHSKTAYNVFCKDSTFELDEVEVKVGNTVRVYFAHEEVEITRAGMHTRVKASELLESDEVAI